MLMLVVTIVGGMMITGSAGATEPGDIYTSISPSRETSITTPPCAGTPCISSGIIVCEDPPCGPHTTSPPPPVVLRRCIGCNSMPITGADLTLFIITGLAAIATGLVIVRRTRSRREPTEPNAPL
jgi:hypothetical protein